MERLTAARNALECIAEASEDNFKDWRAQGVSVGEALSFAAATSERARRAIRAIDARACAPAASVPPSKDASS